METKEFLELEKTASKKCLDFLNKSRSAFAAVETSKNILVENGFVELKEIDEWTLKKGGKYFFTRGMSTIVSFVVGQKYDSKEGFSITAAHTDSPCLKLKPNSKINSFDMNQVGVQTYGGGLWHTWFDRDLGLSGLVLVEKDNIVTSRVVNITKPILRIPSLAIHLNREVNESFSFNKETNLIPILSTQLKSKKRKRIENDFVSTHHDELIDIIAEECGCDPDEIRGLDLSLCDSQDGVLGGTNEEFIFSGRLDNLMMSFCCLDSIVEASKLNLEKESNTFMCILFDNEEVGSVSTNGASSTVLESTMLRIAKNFNTGKDSIDLSIPIKKSLLFSCDMAHGVHPNYSQKHDSNHQPFLHKGPVIKINANQRYATNAETTYITKSIAKIDHTPVQEFVVRNDSPCGSTIGPILAAKLGMRCVDIGISQYAMHSIREMAGTADLVHTRQLLINFYKHFTNMDKNIKID